MISTAETLAKLMPREIESEEPEMESSRHHSQAVILEKSLELLWQDRHDFFIGVNLTVYFSREQLLTHEFRGPDVFIVLGTERRDRQSWITWEEGGKYPDVIFELLSKTTEDVDRVIKKDIYQDRFRTSEYFWFSPQTLEFEGFRLMAGQYQEIPADERGWRWCEKLNLYLGIADNWLRYFTRDGVLIPTPEEAVVQERLRADEETRRANEETRRAEQAERKVAALAAQLREFGIEPESL